MKKIVFLMMLFSGFFFLSCDFLFHKSYREKLICNYPKWLQGYDYFCYGFSSWQDWQSEQGKALHKYVDESIISNDYKGKFRFFLQNQILLICFNDIKQTRACIFYNSIGKTSSCNDLYVYSQDDIENKFEYECYVQQPNDEKETKNKKSLVTMSLISGDSSYSIFNYKQDICGETVLNIELINNKYPQPAIVNDYEDYDWLPILITNENNINEIKFDRYINGYRLFPLSTFCFEGISLRSISDEEHTISFNLLDAKESDFADYFTLKVYKEEKRGEITFYKLVDDIPKIIRVEKNYNLFYK